MLYLGDTVLNGSSFSLKGVFQAKAIAGPFSIELVSKFNRGYRISSSGLSRRPVNAYINLRESRDCIYVC